MEITAEIHKGILVVKINGEFDMRIAPQFKSEVDHYLTQADLKDVVIDMRDVPFIDSSGVGALLGRYKRVTGLGGKIAVCGVQDAVKKILKLSGVLTIIDLYQNEEEALACF